MSWLNKLFGFEGRLGRRDFWLILVAATILNWASMALFPVPFSPPALLSETDPVNRAYLAAAIFQANWLNAVIGLLLLWPCLAASVKRCHDRNRSGLWLIAFWGPALVSGVTGVVVRELWLIWVYGPTGSLYGWPAGPFLTAFTVAFVLWLWGLIELGFLPGSPGKNRFGGPPPPLGARAEVPA